MPNGNLYAWIGNSISATLAGNPAATLPAACYQAPIIITNVTPPAALSGVAASVSGSTLTVTDAGFLGTALISVTASDGMLSTTKSFLATFVSPGVTASAGPSESGNEDSPIAFSGSASGGTGALTYSWDFGDGSAAVTGTLTPSHIYAIYGTYTATLTVTDAAGHTTQSSTMVTVNDVGAYRQQRRSLQRHRRHHSRLHQFGHRPQPARSGRGLHLCLEFRRWLDQHRPESESHLRRCRLLHRHFDRD